MSDWPSPRAGTVEVKEIHRATAGGGQVVRTTQVLRLIARVALRTALGLLVVSVLGFAVHAGIAVWFPHPLEYGEGAVLAAATAVANGAPLYPGLDALPFLSANYPPLYYLLNALAIQFIGPVLWPGRVLSLAGAALVALALALEAHRLSQSRLAALTAATLFLATGPVYHWGAVVKADMLALGLGAAGLSLLARRHDWSGAALLVLAVLTKQSYLTLWLAGMIWLLAAARRDRSQAGALAFGVGGLGAAVALSIAVTGGRFVEHTVAANLQALVPGQMLIAFMLHVEQHGGILLLALAGFAGVALTNRQRDTGIHPTLISPWQVAFVLGLTAFFVTSGKVGAYTNYYLETLAASSLFSALVVASVATRLQRSANADQTRLIVGLTHLVVAGLLLAQAAMMLRLPYLREEITTPTLAELRAGNRVIAALAAGPGPVFAENAAWTLLAGKSQMVDDPFFYNQMVAAGRLDPAPIERAFQQGVFALVVLDFDPADPAAPPYHFDRFTPAMVEALRTRYQIVEQHGNLSLLTPFGAGKMGD